MKAAINDIRSVEKKIIEGRKTGKAIEEPLTTSERVLARVTDGIYRQPSSALRELIANAYDADATQVHILTDAPRFEKIIIRDNGLGLKAKVLAYLIKSIGGSAKRTHEGIDLGITDSEDPLCSPSGRKLIGKIGIGLFSVAQLTNHFQIITKVRNEKFRTFADIVLHNYSEEYLADTKKKAEYKAGNVKIWSTPADDINSQGTEIVLMDIKRSAKEILQSRERWMAVISNKEEETRGEQRQLNIDPPVYHIGFTHDGSDKDTISEKRNLPWDDSDTPVDKFNKLVDSMIDNLGGRINPSLKSVLDNYLQTIWSLSLAIPADYIDGHPFSLTIDEIEELYLLSNEYRGQAEQINMKSGDAVRDAAGLTSGDKKNVQPFDVFIDGVLLRRPIKYSGLPETSHALKKPLLMVGSFHPNIDNIPQEYRGGELEFEAYLFWTPKVVPRDHAGVLVRIHENSGTLFDETFIKYQVSEQTRLRQITAEIFVNKGLDGALNIDRESFNYAHPHYQIIQKWLHGALRQLATTQKRLAGKVRDQERERQIHAQRTELQKAVEEEWAHVRGDDDRPPDIQFTGKGGSGETTKEAGIIFERERIFPVRTGDRKTSASIAESKMLEEKIKAVAAVLSAYGVFDEMPRNKQQELLRAIVRIFTVEAN